jgi:hypothetical protein
MDMSARKVSIMPDEILHRLEALREQHAHLQKPEQAGRIIGVGTRRREN